MSDKETLIKCYNNRLDKLLKLRIKTKDKNEINLIDVQIALITNFILAIQSLKMN